MTRMVLRHHQQLKRDVDLTASKEGACLYGEESSRERPQMSWPFQVGDICVALRARHPAIKLGIHPVGVRVFVWSDDKAKRKAVGRWAKAKAFSQNGAIVSVEADKDKIENESSNRLSMGSMPLWTRCVMGPLMPRMSRLTDSRSEDGCICSEAQEVIQVVSQWT